jgi:hypothetical protein
MPLTLDSILWSLPSVHNPEPREFLESHIFQISFMIITPFTYTNTVSDTILINWISRSPLLLIVASPFILTSKISQKGGNILALIPLTMSSLIQHIESTHCSLMSLISMTFDSNTISCYNGSYFATIVVFSSNQRPMNFLGHQCL